MSVKSVDQMWWDLYAPNTGIRERVERILHSHGIVEPAVVEATLHRIYEAPTEPFATEQAHVCVKRLLADGHAVTIWSQGDPIYQHTKIDHFGFHELYEQLQFIVSADKCEALRAVAATFADQSFVLLDDKVAFLKSGSRTLSSLPHKPHVRTIHIHDESEENDAWTPTECVLGVGQLLETQYSQFFQQPTHVLCDFDRTLFDPDRFTTAIILPLLEKTIATHSN